MRLGDLDALKEQIKNDYCKNHCLLPYGEDYCPSNCSARYFIKMIDDAPTVEIATNLQPNCNNLQQTQGEWVLAYCSCGDRYYTCSICHRAIEVNNGQSLKDYPFCHCGAAMRGAE